MAATRQHGLSMSSVKRLRQDAQLTGGTHPTEAIVSEYASEAAGAIHRLADIGELIADGLFAIAAGMHTDDAASQRNMAAVFCDDARTRYKDVLRKVNKRQRDDMARFIDDICKGKAK